MAQIKQLASYVRTFLMVQSADHITGLTGATPTVNLSKAGAAFASTNAVIAEIGNGYYKASLTSTDTSTQGDLAMHFTAASADPTDFADQIVAFDPFDAIHFGLSALPNASAGANGGLPTADASNQVKVSTVANPVTSGTVIDKAGYSLSQSFPGNFSALSITAGGLVAINSSSSVIVSAPVTVGTSNDKTGYSLTPQERGAIVASAWTTVQVENVGAFHAVPTPIQFLVGLRAAMAEKSVSGTSVTTLLSDGVTVAEVFTLDSTSPTQIHRSA